MSGENQPSKKRIPTLRLLRHHEFKSLSNCWAPAHITLDDAERLPPVLADRRLAAPAAVHRRATKREVLRRSRSPSLHGFSGWRTEEAVVAFARESRGSDGGLVIEVCGARIRVWVFGVVEGGGVL